MLAGSRRSRRDWFAASWPTAGCWAICRHDERYPHGLARRHRRALGADRPRRPRAARRPRAGGGGDVVGSRRATAYGREVARDLSRELAAAGLIVVSGLAFGIDACAHRGALDAGGPTIAVLGCGPDTSYPAAHRSLWRRIAETGVVISELPPGATPWRWSFPARNRVMAALAGMTVVVEAAARSGSLITADLAAELGRDLGAVPGPVTSRASAGPNELLAGGACVVRDAQDVLDAMLGAGVRPSRAAAGRPSTPSRPPSSPRSRRAPPPPTPSRPPPVCRAARGRRRPHPARAPRLPQRLVGRHLHPDHARVRRMTNWTSATNAPTSTVA